MIVLSTDKAAYPINAMGDKGFNGKKSWLLSPEN